MVGEEGEARETEEEGTDVLIGEVTGQIMH